MAQNLLRNHLVNCWICSSNSESTVDMYNPEMNTLDIRSNGLYPSNVLSNLCSNGFRFDGMVCGSMEGFLQSLKRQDLDKQRQICSMKGGNARKMSVTSWQTDQIVWWKGHAIDRQGKEFQSLIRQAYQAMFDQSERFRAALMQTRGMTLVHSTGESNPFKTILTSKEFCDILTELRESYDRRDKTQELKDKSIDGKIWIKMYKSRNSMSLQDKIRGSLIGGAIGDALGYPVEFVNSFEGIQKRYGEHGITKFDTTQWSMDVQDNNGKAVISDDTQMTLFTANGLLNAAKNKSNPNYLYGICMAYIEWYLTQIGKKSGKYKDCWIAKLPELNKRRAPGQTCMESLYSLYKGWEPQNNSKGCGGIMRIAPIPLFAAVNKRMSITDAMKLAASASEITHQHPLGFLPSALESYIIYNLMEKEESSLTDFKNYVDDGLAILRVMFPEHDIHVGELKSLIEKAIKLADNSLSDVENIENIGGGWTAEETLAIAVYCIVKYYGDFEKAVIAAVNHGGDSDSTGAVLGNILGTVVGYDALPQHFKENIELHDVILHMADELLQV